MKTQYITENEVIITMGIELTNEQVFATYQGERWYKERNNQVFEISGAAGTGKTTLVCYLIERLGLSLDQVLFIAYMGKAVSQLSRHGLPAKTLHSAIYNYKRVPEVDEDGHFVIKANGKIKMVGKFELKEKIGKKKIKLIVLDEGSTVEQRYAEDLLSFGIPVIVLGDLNQLPPPFGRPYFLKKPDIILTQILRQKEGDPIIWLSQQVLHGEQLRPGVYGNSAVIKKDDLTDYQLKNSDIVLTGTNRLRLELNNYYREVIKEYRRLEYPHIGEKLICRKNNWDRVIDDGIYLTNGTTGVCTYVERESYNGRSLKIDFQPDFSKSQMRNIAIDYKRLMTQNLSETHDPDEFFDFTLDVFEYAYAITVHSSQGSQYPNVLFMAEKFMSDDDFRRFMYTGITRAMNSVTVVI